MKQHDRLPVYDRWGSNQWGEEWVTQVWTRPLFARDAPPFLTDPTPEAFAAITGERLCREEQRSIRQRWRLRNRPPARG
jgi:hypothetical protein